MSGAEGLNERPDDGTFGSFTGDRCSFAPSGMPRLPTRARGADVPGTLGPGSIFAGYRIDGALGRGGMGIVYRAIELQLDRPVALKLIAPELAQEPRFRERF